MQRIITLVLLCFVSLSLVGCADLQRKLDIAMYGSEEKARIVNEELEVERNERERKKQREMEKETFDLLNEHRRKNGLSNLPRRNDMQNYARMRAKELSERFDRYRPNGELYSTLFDEIKELQQSGYKPSRELRARALIKSDTVVDYWMLDSQSRKLILSNGLACYAVGVFGKGGTYYWVLVTAY